MLSDHQLKIIIQRQRWRKRHSKPLGNKQLPLWGTLRGEIQLAADDIDQLIAEVEQLERALKLSRLITELTARLV